MNYRDFITAPNRNVAVVAHRGAWNKAPENSLDAIETAIKIGCEIVELDIRKSADGELFLMHDLSLLRTAGIDRSAETFTMRELQAIPLRNRNGGIANLLTDQKIPTLRQVFELTRGRIFVDLDLKDRGNFPQAAALARDMHVHMDVDLKAPIENQSDVDWIRSQQVDDIPFMSISRFTSTTIDERLEVLARLTPFMCEVSFDDINTIASKRHIFSDMRMALWINTLNQVGSGAWTDDAALADPDAIWGRLIDAGISVIQTDQLETLKGYIQARNRARQSALDPAQL